MSSVFPSPESCSHVFCLTCIRQWRDPKKKDEQTNAKSCSFALFFLSTLRSRYNALTTIYRRALPLVSQVLCVGASLTL